MNITVTQTERISVRKAVALILAASVNDGLPFPQGIRQNGVDSSILCFDFNSLTDLDAWVDFFGAESPQPRKHPDLPVVFAIVCGDWSGWSVQLRGEDRYVEPKVEPVDAEVGQILANVLAAEVIRTHLTSRTHPAACETWGGHGEGHITTAVLADVDCTSCLDEVACLAEVQS